MMPCDIILSSHFSNKRIISLLFSGRFRFTVGGLGDALRKLG